MNAARPTWQRRLASALLFILPLAVLGMVLPQWPQEQQVVFHIGAPEKVRGLAATWTQVGEDEASGGLRLSFPGGAPAKVEQHLSLPNGDYVFEVLITRGQGVDSAAFDETTRRHRVTLEGHAVTLYLSEPSR